MAVLSGDSKRPEVDISEAAGSTLARQTRKKTRLCVHCGARLKDSRKEKRLVGTKLYNIIIHHLFF